MSIHPDFITRFLEDDQAYLLLCDGRMRVTAVNARIRREALPIQPGQLLDEVFIGCSKQLDAAYEKLRSGTPVCSTNFELNLLCLTFFMVPFLEDGRLSSVLCCADIPEREGLAQSSSLLPLISDRYRSPISNTLNILGMLASRCQRSEDYKSLDYLNAAARNCYGMLRSTSLVSRYHKLVNGTVETNFQWLDLSDFVSNLLQTLQVVFRKTQYKLRCNVPEEVLITRADEPLLSQALFHLIANSCTFSPEDSTIRVALTRQGDAAHITVTDEGIGISRDNLERIFAPFYSKRDVPVPEEEMGLGLGLPIAKRIVELHGGRIFVVSEENRGTTVAIALPLKEPDSRELILHSDSAKYVTDHFSDMYLMFSDICDIRFY